MPACRYMAKEGWHCFRKLKQCVRFCVGFKQDLFASILSLEGCEAHIITVCLANRPSSLVDPRKLRRHVRQARASKAKFQHREGKRRGQGQGAAPRWAQVWFILKEDERYVEARFNAPWPQRGHRAHDSAPVSWGLNSLSRLSSSPSSPTRCEMYRFCHPHTS